MAQRPRKLRATVTVEYEPNADHYGTNDIAEMGRIDAEHWRHDPMAFLATFEDDEYTVSVEPVS